MAGDIPSVSEAKTELGPIFAALDVLSRQIYADSRQANGLVAGFNAAHVYGGEHLRPINHMSDLCLPGSLLLLNGDDILRLQQAGAIELPGWNGSLIDTASVVVRQPMLQNVGESNAIISPLKCAIMREVPKDEVHHIELSDDHELDLLNPDLLPQIFT
jgi:hypothetical protein